MVHWSMSDPLDDYASCMANDHLDEFTAQCFGESTILKSLFQTLCRLYNSLPGERVDDGRKSDVYLVINMLVRTFIMETPITIVQGIPKDLLENLSLHDDPFWLKGDLSPVVADRQIKHIFSTIRDHQYRMVFNRLQRIMRAAQDKGKRWMSAFVLMLGIAMSGERCQELIQTQEPTELGQTLEDIEFEKRRDCREIDNAFDFMCKLYHCKYRGRRRQMTRFSEWSTQTLDPAEDRFVKDITDIVDREGGQILQARENGPAEGFSGRLVSRFLVDLMGLDESDS